MKARRVLRELKRNGPPPIDQGPAAQTAERRRSRIHVVIGDVHLAPGPCLDEHLEMIQAVGELCAKLKADQVVSLGDWFDLPALSPFDKDRRSAEGRRADEDFEAGNAGLHAFERGLGGWRPLRRVTLGNHEARIDRATQLHPELEGVLSQDLMDWERYGWDVTQFQHHVEIDGMYYTHWLPSGVRNQPISGKAAPRTLVQEAMASVAVGHSHLLQHHVHHTPFGRKFHGLVAGCYFPYRSPVHDYAGAASRFYWHGVCVLHNVQDGDFDLETWSVERVLGQPVA